MAFISSLATLNKCWSFISFRFPFLFQSIRFFIMNRVFLNTLFQMGYFIKWPTSLLYLLLYPYIVVFGQGKEFISMYNIFQGVSTRIIFL